MEDNELNQEVATELLQAVGAQVTLARHGREAIEMLRAHPNLCDAVLSDVHMPEMDGYTLTGLIRQDPALHHLPVVAMTANASPADRERCLQAGMDEHVSKPFEIEDLVRVLLRCVKQDRPHPAQAATTTADANASTRRFPRVTVPARLCEPAHQHGIDAQEGIDRFMGKVPMYQRMVRSFISSTRSLPDRLQTQLQQGQIEDAIISLHSLKGLAGTLAAHRLADVGAKGEDLLRAGRAPDTAWLTDLREQVAQGCAALEALADGLDDLRPDEPPRL